MTPINFPEANMTLFGSDDPMPDPIGKIKSLKVWAGSGLIVSQWRPSWRERLSVLIFGRVWLAVVGDTTPPVSVQGCRTIFEPAGPVHHCEIHGDA